MVGENGKTAPRRRGSGTVEPRSDHGLFGPDSVAWRVWGYPTSLTVGFQRAVVVEELDPFLLASVEATNKIRTQARTRYDHTIRYFAIVAFADSRTTVKASETLMKVHARNVGIEPVSGLRFDANDPDSQLWILLTGWHSVLYTYEKYGPGKLSAEDERHYWEDCATAAQLQTCAPDKVPRTRDGIREYFEQVRPRLAATEATQATMDHLLNASVMFPPLPAVLRPAAWVVSRFVRAGTIATMPRWQRKLANLRQSRLTDIAIFPVMWTAFHLAALSVKLQLRLLGLISPGTVSTVDPVFRGIKPEHEDTVAPAEAFRRHGVPTPAQIYARQQAATPAEERVAAPAAPAFAPTTTPPGPAATVASTSSGNPPRRRRRPLQPGPHKGASNDRPVGNRDGADPR